MPMIDVYAAVDTFADKHTLAAELARTLMTIEQVPDIAMFRKNNDLAGAALAARRRQLAWRCGKRVADELRVRPSFVLGTLAQRCTQLRIETYRRRRRPHRRTPAAPYFSEVFCPSELDHRTYVRVESQHGFRGRAASRSDR
jgi:hypothetical protein